MTDPTVPPTGVEADTDRTPRRRSRGNAGLVTGAVLFGVVVVIAVVAPILLGAAATEMTSSPRLPMSWEHPFGTDEFGRDMLARSLVATRLTLILAVAATLVSVVVGVVIGGAVRLAPGRVREVGLRLIEVAVSYPALLVALIVAAIMGAGSMAVVLGVGVAGIASYARLTANLVSDVSHRDYVVTARLLGVPRWRIITRHLLPNIAEPMLILVATGFAVAVMESSGLSFVGLGVQSPDVDLGKLLIDALPSIYTRPEQVVGPVVMIVLIIISAMLIGDGLAASANPRVARRRDAERASVSAAPAVHGEAVAGGDLVTIRDLRVSAGGRELVHGVDLRIGRGEIVGVVGESGSGKSLTAMALAQLLAEGVTATARELRIGDLDLRRPVARRDLAHAVSLVYQDPGTTFSPALRLGTQLTEVPRVHYGDSRSAARERIVAAFDAVRLRHPARAFRQYPHELSGGMRQRAMIAGAVATAPALIIADEPTTALDVTVQAEVLRGFRRINEEGGAAMLFISHDIAVVADLCHRVLVMRDGTIVEELSAEQLAVGDVGEEYTRQLIAATPRLKNAEGLG